MIADVVRQMLIEAPAAFKRIASAIHVFPVAAAAAIALALAEVPQMRELYIVYAEGMLTGSAADALLRFLQAVFGVLTLALLSVLIYSANERLSRMGVDVIFRDHDGDIVDPTQKRGVLAVGTFAATLPWIGILCGIHQAVHQSKLYIERLGVPGTAIGRDAQAMTTALSYFDPNVVLRAPIDPAQLAKLHASLKSIDGVLGIVPNIWLFILIWSVLVLAFSLRRYIWLLVTLTFSDRRILATNQQRGARQAGSSGLLGPRANARLADLLLDTRLKYLPLVRSKAFSATASAAAVLAIGSIFVPVSMELTSRASPATFNLLDQMASAGSFFDWITVQGSTLFDLIEQWRTNVAAYAPVESPLASLCILIIAGGLFGLLCRMIMHAATKDKPHVLSLVLLHGLMWILWIGLAVETLTVLRTWTNWDGLAASLASGRVDAEGRGTIFGPIGAWATCTALAGVTLWVLCQFTSRPSRPPSLTSEVRKWPWLINVPRSGFCLSRYALGLAGLASLMSGFREFEWVDIARSLGPIASGVAFVLAVMTMIVALLMIARQSGLPALAVLFLTGLVITTAKLERFYHLLIAFNILLPLTLWAIVRRDRTPMLGLVAGCLTAIAGFGAYHYWPSNPPLWTTAIIAALLLLPFLIRDHWRAPWMAVCSIVGLALYIFPVDHILLTVEPTPEVEEKQAELSRNIRPVFNEWMRIREVSEYKKKTGAPYPVFIIAAEGGGIYAAAAASTVLARLQADCPSFAQHVFAVSGVSGGAVGAAIFDSAIREASADRWGKLVPEGCNPRNGFGDKEAATAKKRIETALAHDHLSPLLGLIIPDVLGTLSDRAWGLQKSLEESLSIPLAGSALTNANLLVNLGNFNDHWQPGSPYPGLVFNTTLTRDGTRVIFSPFDFGSDRPVSLNTFTALGQSNALSQRLDRATPEPLSNVTLMQSAVVSARFPGVVSAFELTSQDNSRWYFVDGGYVDASGALTAYDIYRALSRSDQVKTRVSANEIELRLILITSSSTDSVIPRGPQLRDIAAPVETLLNVRSLLSRIAVRDTLAQVHWGTKFGDKTDEAVKSIEMADYAQQGCPDDWKASVISLNQTDFELPLGWTLSDLTREIISAQIGDSDLCEAATDPARAPRLQSRLAIPDAKAELETQALETAKTIRANSCVLASVKSLLQDTSAIRADKSKRCRQAAR